MPYHLAYTSATRAPASPDFLADVLEVSERNNLRDGITGVLLYHDQSFFQVLEGEKAAVEDCYARICGDTRHVGALRLWTQSVDARVFSDWAMGYGGPDQIQRFTNPGQDSLIRLLRQRASEPAGETVALQLARQMYKRFRLDTLPYSGPILT